MVSPICLHRFLEWDLLYKLKAQIIYKADTTNIDLPREKVLNSGIFVTLTFREEYLLDLQEQEVLKCQVNSLLKDLHLKLLLL